MNPISSVQKTVLKIDLSCGKCKKKLLKAVSSVEGVDKMEADSTKGTLSVIGNADPYKIIVSARKAAPRRHVEVVSVGLPPPPPQPKAKPPEEKKGSDVNKSSENQKKIQFQQVISGVHDPLTCLECQRHVFVPFDRDRPWNDQPADPSCFIM